MRKPVLTALAAVLLSAAPMFASAAYGDDVSSTPDVTQQDVMMGDQSDVLRPGADPNDPNQYPYLPEGMQVPTPGDRTHFPQAPVVDSSSTSSTTSSGTSTTNAAVQTNTFPDIAIGKPYTIGTQWTDQLFHSIEARSYGDNGQLTNGQTATLKYSDKGWVGLLRQYGRSVTVNLGGVQNVRRVSLDFLQDLGAGIDFPDSVTYYASNDGVNWYSLGTAWSAQGGGDYTPQSQDFPVDANVNAQYIRAQFEDQVFSFVDEFSVFGSTQPAQGAKPLVGNGQDLTQYIGDNYLVDPNAPGLPTAPPGQTLVTPPADRGAPTPSGYLMSSESAAAGIKNMQLVYTGANGSIGEWTKNDFLPMIAQEDANGTPKGWLYDGTQFGEYSNKTPTSVAGWTGWLNDLFSPNLELSALDQAVGSLKQQLSDPNFKEKVVITIPILSSNPSNFGSIDSSGQNIDLNPSDVGQLQSTANKIKVVQWYTQQVLDRWNAANFSNLQLVGFYWEPESLNTAQPYDYQLVEATSNIVHGNHLNFFWIPYYGAPGITEWHQLGFDSVMIQPNVSFNWSIDAGARLKSTADQAQYYHTGLEMEQHWFVTSSNISTATTAQNKYYDYFTGGNVYGYENGVLKSWYLNSKTLVDCYNSTNPFYHQVYDNTVQFVNGQWTGTTFQ